MQIKPTQLATYLRNHNTPVYWIAGDEPLQLMESVDAVRAHARGLGFAQREIFDAGPGFNWQHWLQASQSLSLFAEKRIFELRMPTGSPGKDGAQVLLSYLQNPVQDALLLVQSGKIERRTKNSAWFKALLKTGVLIEVWPLKPTEMMPWIRQRMAALGLRADDDAVRLIAQRVEGNMLAAAQELDKLRMLGLETITFAHAEMQVVSSSRYSVYALADACLYGPEAAARCLRILYSLRAEGISPVQVLPPLVAVLREILPMIRQFAEGVPLSRITANVWSSRKKPVNAAVAHLDEKACQQMLRHAAKIDQLNKGVVRGGDPWLELQCLVLNLVRIFPKRLGTAIL